jgi:hypothetical protein
MFGLMREALIEGDFEVGSTDLIRQKYTAADSPGILVTPSALGTELFLWAHSKGDMTLNSLLKPWNEVTCGAKISTTPGIRSVRFPDRGYPKPVLPDPADGRTNAL